MTALYSVLVKLRAENDTEISPTQGHHAYALFLDLLGHSSPGLSAGLHRDDASKPFTVSPLIGRFRRTGNGISIGRGAEYSLRLTFLKDDIYAHFMDAACKCADKPLRLETAVFSIQQVCFSPRQSLRCRMTSYEELYYGAGLDSSITLRFTSPTTFRSGGKRNVLMPDPALVFSSYLRKWQYFSPLKLDDGVAEHLKGITLSKHRVKTYIWHFTGYQETGFEGECIFTIPPLLDKTAVKAINTLAGFACYCGTGAKTTMGMGQTRRIK